MTTTELTGTQDALRDSEQRYRTLVAGVPLLVWRATHAGAWIWSSPQWTEYTGQREEDGLGWGWLDALHPDDRQVARDAWAHAVERGGFAVEWRIRRAADSIHRWFKSNATAVRDDRGVITEWIGACTDIDDLRALQERQAVLVGELQHRTRNLLAVVRAMADKTIRSSDDLPGFRQAFRDRLDALARVQGMLSRLNEHDRVTFDELIRSELAAHGVTPGAGRRVTIDGPSGVRLRSGTVQTLALALHELATNAVKYGAIGQPDARLAITWRLRQDGDKPMLVIDWRESGVRMPVEGATQGGGQGRELIERALPYQLGATTTFAMGVDGVNCSVIIPVSPSSMRPD